MHIDSYSFGKIVIDGKAYTSDVIVYTDSINSAWWRKEGHYLQKSDLADIIAARPDVLIIGTGNMGVMNIPESTLSFLKSHGIEVFIEKTGRAVELFNTLPGDRVIIGAFHLTC